MKIFLLLNERLNEILALEGKKTIDWEYLSETGKPKDQRQPSFASLERPNSEEAADQYIDDIKQVLIKYGLDNIVDFWKAPSKSQPGRYRVGYDIKHADRIKLQKILYSSHQINDICIDVNLQKAVPLHPTNNLSVNLNCKLYPHPVNQTLSILQTKFKIENPSAEVIPRNIVFILDKSGSMTGYFNHLKRITKEMIRKLSAKDTVSIIMFNDSAKIIVDRQAVDNFETSGLNPLDSVVCEGSTNLIAPFDLASGFKTNTSSIEDIFVFVTDGQDTVNKNVNIETAITSTLGDIRLITVGIGRVYNKALIDSLTEKAQMPTSIHIADEKGFDKAGEIIDVMLRPTSKNVEVSTIEGKKLHKGRLVYGAEITQTLTIKQDDLDDGLDLYLKHDDIVMVTTFVCAANKEMALPLSVLFDWVKANIKTTMDDKTLSKNDKSIKLHALTHTLNSRANEITSNSLKAEFNGLNTLIAEALKGCKGDENAARNASYQSSSSTSSYEKIYINRAVTSTNAPTTTSTPQQPEQYNKVRFNEKRPAY